MAIVHNDGQGVKLGPPHPSARLPHDVSMGIHEWPIRYPGLHPVGMVGYRLTQ
jgi:hypothetical protein